MTNPPADRLERLRPQRSTLLQNRHIALRDIFPADYGALYELCLSDGVMDTWQAGSQSVSFDRFCASLWENSLVSFGFGVPGSRDLLGFVKVELANFRHQTAQIAIFSSPDAQGSALPMMAMATLVDFTMRRYPVRKLYAEVPEYNYAALSSGAGTFFDVEGRLVQHEIVNNELWDTFIIAISRERWAGVIQPLVESWRSAP